MRRHSTSLDGVLYTHSHVCLLTERRLVMTGRRFVTEAICSFPSEEKIVCLSAALIALKASFAFGKPASKAAGFCMHASVDTAFWRPKCLASIKIQITDLSCGNGCDCRSISKRLDMV